MSDILTRISEERKAAGISTDEPSPASKLPELFLNGGIILVKYLVRCERCDTCIEIEAGITDLANKENRVFDRLFEKGWHGEWCPVGGGAVIFCPKHNTASAQISSLSKGNFFVTDGDLFMMTAIKSSQPEGWSRAINLATGNTTDFSFDKYVKWIKKKDAFSADILQRYPGLNKL